MPSHAPAVGVTLSTEPVVTESLGIEVIYFEARMVRKCTGHIGIGCDEKALWMWLFH